ncbi:MAG TPA: hypothetical protein VG962_03735 [Steroidobacteraceae bacterium]|nr:hypothetical protein [Steroidobacteraceae bacterium]
MNGTRHVLIPVIALLLAGCDMSRYEPVTVAVYPSTHSCSINNNKLDCETVGAYLRDTMKVSLKRHIDVSYTGADPPATKDDPMVDQVANTVRAAGYKDVNAARFDLR